MLSETTLNGFIDLFTGLDRAYGLYHLPTEAQIMGGKVKGHGTTHAGLVTTDLYEQHLRGELCLGITPIMDGDVCMFGAIDIDVYEDTYQKEVVKKIREFGMPLIPCRTKSGGLHLYCFVSEPVPAKMLRDKLKIFSAYLGFGDSEIFPAQDAILSDKGDCGNWINLPYWDRLDTDRYAIDENGKKLDIDQMIAKARELRWGQKQFAMFNIIQKLVLEDAPPCVETLLNAGISEGGRNKSLFGVSLYLRRKYGEGWQAHLENVNQEFCRPPMDTREVEGVYKSVQKGDYGYPCKTDPFSGLCNRVLCKQRKFGIRDNDSVMLKNLTKYASTPPIWFVDLEGLGRLEVGDSSILINQSMFIQLCMDQYNILPKPFKKDDWAEVIRNLLEDVQVINIPSDASDYGIFDDLFNKFCMGRMQGNTIEDCVTNKPFRDKDGVYFRFVGLYNFLERNKFKAFQINKLAQQLKQKGCQQQDRELNGKAVSLWFAPITMFEVGSKLPVPEIKENSVF